VEPQGLVMATEVVSPEGLRLDGRRLHEMRHMHAVVGVVPKNTGYVYQGVVIMQVLSFCF
jgi:exosome complex RNA-binding protein Rrp42 (RNase PH superfamily)